MLAWRNAFEGIRIGGRAGLARDMRAMRKKIIRLWLPSAGVRTAGGLVGHPKRLMTGTGRVG